MEENRLQIFHDQEAELSSGIITDSFQFIFITILLWLYCNLYFNTNATDWAY